MASVLRSLAISAGLIGPTPRRYFPANSCLSRKENKFGVGLKLRRPPAKQQGPGSQRQPRPSLAYGDQRFRGEIGKRCLGEGRRIGAVVCSPTRFNLSRMQLPEWSLHRSLGYGLSAEVHSYPCGIDGAYAQKAFSCQLLLVQEGEHVWSGFPTQGTTSKAAGPREPEAAQTLFGLWRAEG